MGEKPTKWYLCKRDISITFLIIIVTFIINPIARAYEFLRVTDDWGILGVIVIVSIVFTVSLFICLKHYWQWVVVATFGVTAAVIISDFVFRPALRQEYSIGMIAWELLLNGLIFLACTIPVAALVFFIRNKRGECHDR